MSQDFSEFDERGRGLDRVIAFSDGVFAIAITLLVLSFQVPHVGSHDQGRQLFDGLRHESGLLLGFALSFYVIAKYWRVHHRFSLLLKTLDSRFITLNLVFLALVVFLPFPTEIVGRYGSTATAVVLYASTMVLVSTASTVLWLYASRAQLLDDRAGDVRGQILSRSLPPIVVFALSLPLAFVNASGAKFVWLGLIATPFVRPYVGVRRSRRGSARPEPRSG